MTTTPSDHAITVTLSDRAPVTIARDAWPVIARAEWFSGQHECQANYVKTIRVRQHKDGRTLVYGWHKTGPGGSPHYFRDTYAGYLLAAGEDIVRAIRRVAGSIDADDLASECIGDLPAERID